MKRFLFILMLITTAISLLSACRGNNKVNKTDSDKVKRDEALSSSLSASDETANDTELSDIDKSDTVKSDAAQSDISNSSELSVDESLDGVWQYAKSKRIVTLAFNAKNNMYMRTVNGKAEYGEFASEENTLILNDNDVYEMTLDESTLILKEKGEKKSTEYKKIEKHASSLKKEAFYGSWKCSITALKDNSELEIMFTLRDDGTCSVMMNDSLEIYNTTAVWSLKKGILILDNGGGKDSSKLKYTVLYLKNGAMTLDIDGFAVNLVKDK